ncbi:hypothetical protein Tco_0840978 [Tanacetum coccineum]|uniref:Uncharacterized protein n=1 Tax=Tanacetum coccineum TaxID=301880 RepID=A0ABQ5AV28_9ASTR
MDKTLGRLDHYMCNMLSAIHTDQMHQPWRTFAAIINRCISRKKIGLDRLRESRAQILWGMYNKKNVDYVALLWEDFMYQADNREISSARKEHMPYLRFTKVIINHFISKDKTISIRNRINLPIIRDDSLLDIKDSQAYKTYYDFTTRKVPPRKARKYKKVASPSRKLSYVKEAEPVKKGKRVKRPAKTSITVPTAGVTIRDTPRVSVSKKKAPAKDDRSKGIEILSDVALSKAAQLKEATKRSKKDYYISQASGSGDGTDFESGGDSEDDNDDDSDDDSKGDDDKADSDNDGNSDADDNERTDSDDDDENPSFTLKDYDEEEHDEEYESDDDNEMFKFLILENVPPIVDEVDSMMNVKNRQEESCTQAPSLFTVPEMAILEFSTAHTTTIPLTISMITPPSQLATPSPVPTTVLTTTSIPALLNFSSLFRFDQRVSTLETELSQLKQADHSAQLLKSVKSQLPTMVDDLLSTRIGYATRTALDLLPQILPKEVSDFVTPVIQSTINESLENVILAKSSSQPKSTCKEAESLTEFELKKILLDKMERSESYKTSPKHKELYEGLVKSYNLHKDLFSSYGNVYSLKRDRDDKDKYEDPSAGSSRAEEPVFETTDTRMPQDQGGDTEDQPNVETTPMDDCNIAKARQPPRTFDELMSTPIDFSAYVMHNLKIDNLTQEISVGPAFNLLKGRQVVPVDYFFNNDLEYLKGGSSSRKYITSITKTMAAKYDDIKGIEDMVPEKRIIAVTHVKVMKWYGYGYLEEIIVRREDQTLHKFKEGDFPRLNLCDIEDLLLLLRVEDLQLRVKSYKKKLNITKPETFISDIPKLTPYTAYKNPQGIIYLDKYKRNRLIRLDELYKFYDGTLTSVRQVLHDIANNLRMNYFPKRRWSNLDRIRSYIMIKAIDQQLFERRLMRNLEKFVGGREYGNDFRLLERMI